MDQTLPEKMNARADADGLAVDHEIRVMAKRLEAASSNPQTPIPELLGTWARTRKLWCAYSGEPLI